MSIYKKRRNTSKMRTGKKYNTVRDDRGNLLEYDSLQSPYDEEDGRDLIEVHHKFTYDDNDRKTLYLNSKNRYSMYQYNDNGTMKYCVNGNLNSGMYTEHFYDNNGNEYLSKRVDETNLVVEKRGISTKQYRVLFRKAFEHDLGIL